MNFDLTDEQKLLKESVDRLMAGHYDLHRRRNYAATPEGWSRAMWTRYAEMGLLGLSIEEEYGGLGLGFAETAIVMEAFGRGLALEPYLATAVFATELLRSASEPLKRTWLPLIADGSAIAAVAYMESSVGDCSLEMLTRAERHGQSWRLRGRKVLVLQGDVANILIVAARTDDRQDGNGRISLFSVDARAKGVTASSYVLQDETRAADIVFDDVVLEEGALIGAAGEGLPILERGIEAAIVALSAEAIGCMNAALDETVSYMRIRKQFGVPIASFQALKHRVAEVHIALELSRSMALLVGANLRSARGGERSLIVSAAKSFIGEQGRLVAEALVQLHGGLGMTDECKVGHYFKRLVVMEKLFGDSEHHLMKIAASGRSILSAPASAPN